jgi:hypothetical protein
MSKNIVALACVLWAAVAISSATPANAYAATQQYGEHAACSAANSNWMWPGCWIMSYKQIIKFQATSCGSGSCGSSNGDVYTESVYGTGRHVATCVDGCDGYNLYVMEPCSC